MVDLVQKDMLTLWADTGDILAPDDTKISNGWDVELVPRQWWNWMQNRVDTNVAYLLQKGIPEWNSAVEYIINKSYVQHLGVVYKCIQTHTNQTPAVGAYWTKAFNAWSAVGEAVGGVTPAADTYVYFTSPTAAATATMTPYARTLLDDADAAAARTTLNAQQADATLTALAGVASGTNKLPYFTGADVAAVTDLTAFARTLLDDGSAAAARTTLELYSTGDIDAIAATKQPLGATLTALAGTAAATNTLPYYTGTDTAAVTPFTAYARTLLDDLDAPAARTTLDVYSKAQVDAADATKQPLDATLSAFAGLVTGSNLLPYFTNTDVMGTTGLTPFGRTLIDDADAATCRATLGLANSATIAATSGNGASTIVQRDASGDFSAGTIAADLIGNASTATTLETARTIALSGEVTGTATSFNGGANISIATSITDSGLLTPTLVNGFSHGGIPLRYRKVGNIVHVEGQVNRATAPLVVTCTTLPAGYRPSRSVSVIVELYGATNAQRVIYSLALGSTGELNFIWPSAEATNSTQPTGTLTFSINFMFVV